MKSIIIIILSIIYSFNSFAQEITIPTPSIWNIKYLYGFLGYKYDLVTEKYYIDFDKKTDIRSSIENYIGDSIRLVAKYKESNCYLFYNDTVVGVIEGEFELLNKKYEKNLPIILVNKEEHFNYIKSKIYYLNKRYAIYNRMIDNFHTLSGWKSVPEKFNLLKETYLKEKKKDYFGGYSIYINEKDELKGIGESINIHGFNGSGNGSFIITSNLGFNIFNNSGIFYYYVNYKPYYYQYTYITIGLYDETNKLLIKRKIKFYVSEDNSDYAYCYKHEEYLDIFDFILSHKGYIRILGDTYGGKDVDFKIPTLFSTLNNKIE